MAVKRKDGRIDPEWVRSTGQVLNLAIVETMLIQHGFKAAEHTGGSHFKFKHPLIEKPVTIVHGTDKLASQREAAKICMHAVELERDQRRQAREAKRAAAETKADFSAAARSQDEVETLSNLPKDIEGFEFEGLVVLRPKKLKQIGGFAQLQMYPSSLRELCATLRDEANAYLNALGEGNRDYETQFHFEDGDMLVIEHPRYGVGIEIPPFHPDNDVDFYTHARSFGYTVQAYDRIFRYNVQNAVSKHQEHNAARFLARGHGNQKDILCKLTSQHPLTGEDLVESVICSSGGRPSPQEFFRWIDEGFENSIGGVLNSRLISDYFRNDYGIETRRPPTPGKKKGKGDVLVFLHPFHPDFRYEMRAPDSIPRAQEIAKRYEDDYLNPELLNELIAKKEQTDKIIEVVCAMHADLEERKKQVRARVNGELMIEARKLGLIVRPLERRIKPSDYFKVQQACLHDPVTNKRGGVMRVIFTSDSSVLFDHNDLEGAKEFLAEIMVERAKRSDLTSQIRGSGFTSLLGGLPDDYDTPGMH